MNMKSETGSWCENTGFKEVSIQLFWCWTIRQCALKAPKHKEPKKADKTKMDIIGKESFELQFIV